MRVGHVLANLVDNARKYGGDGPVTISARRARGMVVVTVTDTGPGIAPEERTLVFDRFYRGRASRDGGPRGSGLGLYVCRRLVEAHGGEIWVEPEDGRSAISFSLPAARQAPARSRP
jgi:signal transduction histidine kinase